MLLEENDIGSFNVPILFIIFNRLETTLEVFTEIKKAKPQRLYISSDGPRSSEEEVRVNEVRELVLGSINWDCKVFTLFREKNLGCGKAVSGAIDWLFQNEVSGIILEDDCLPAPGFFAYCAKMLTIYSKDENIMMVSGTNYAGKRRLIENGEYFFSKNFSIWGWATWRRAWEKYNFEINDWNEAVRSKKLKEVIDNWLLYKYYSSVFHLVKNKKINTWDYQWVYCCIYNQGFSIVPVENLITNIGVNGTHSGGKQSENHFLPLGEIDFLKLKEVKNIYNCKEYDSIVNSKLKLAYLWMLLIRILEKIYVLKIYRLVKSK